MKLLRLDQAYPISKLRPFPRNARQHDLEAIGRALDRGQHRTVVVREETGEVLAGNGVYAAALEKGWDSLAVSAVECSDEEAVEVVLEDNRSQELGRYDHGLLASLLQEVDERGRLEAVGYDKDYLNGLLDEINRPMAGEGDPDDVPAPPKEPITKPGDLWLLGKHGRVLCGDETNPDDVRRLIANDRVDAVFTDPPYGISIVQGGHVGAGKLAKVRDYRPVVGDDTTDTAVEAYRLCAVLEVPLLIFWGPTTTPPTYRTPLVGWSGISVTEWKATTSPTVSWRGRITTVLRGSWPTGGRGCSERPREGRVCIPPRSQWPSLCGLSTP